MAIWHATAVDVAARSKFVASGSRLPPRTRRRLPFLPPETAHPARTTNDPRIHPFTHADLDWTELFIDSDSQADARRAVFPTELRKRLELAVLGEAGRWPGRWAA